MMNRWTVLSWTLLLMCGLVKHCSSGSEHDFATSKGTMIIGWEFLLTVIVLFIAIFYFYNSKVNDLHRHELKEMKFKAEFEFLKKDMEARKEEHEELRKQNIHLQADIRVYKENEEREIRRRKRQRRDSCSVASEGSVPSENEDPSMPIDTYRTITRNRSSASSYPSVQNYFISLPADGTYEPVQDSGFSASNNNISMYSDDTDD